MLRQHHRRLNLSHILSTLELAGITTPQAQADALGNIATARKLTRMMLGGNVPSMFARGAEHAFELKRGWMDLPYNAPPPLPKRLARMTLPPPLAEETPPLTSKEPEVA
ncbi:MAG: hypothetical protein WBW32_01325 [Luteibacter sp.]